MRLRNSHCRPHWQVHNSTEFDSSGLATSGSANHGCAENLESVPAVPSRRRSPGDLGVGRNRGGGYRLGSRGDNYSEAEHKYSGQFRRLEPSQRGQFQHLIQSPAIVRSRTRAPFLQSATPAMDRVSSGRTLCPRWHVAGLSTRLVLVSSATLKANRSAKRWKV